MKLMFVGVQGIGKTSLLAQLRKEGKSSSNKNKVYESVVRISFRGLFYRNYCTWICVTEISEKKNPRYIEKEIGLINYLKFCKICVICFRIGHKEWAMEASKTKI